MDSFCRVQSGYTYDHRIAFADPEAGAKPSPLTSRNAEAAEIGTVPDLHGFFDREAIIIDQSRSYSLADANGLIAQESLHPKWKPIAGIPTEKAARRLQEIVARDPLGARIGDQLFDPDDSLGSGQSRRQIGVPREKSQDTIDEHGDFRAMTTKRDRKSV